jgi:signal peptidase
MINLIKKTIGGLLTIVALGLAALLLVPSILGLDRYVIVTGSMSGTYDTGSVVFTESVPVAELRVGDVITYAPPPGETSTELVTHRIASINTVKGEPIYRTKGDANESVDPWRFQLEEPTQARVTSSVPYVGHGLLALQDRATRMVLIGIPALSVAVFALLGVFRDRRRVTTPDLPHAPPLEVPR